MNPLCQNPVQAFVVVMAVALFAVPQSMAAPKTHSPMKASTKQLKALFPDGKPIDPKADAEIGVKNTVVTFDSDGRRTTTYHRIVKVMTTDGVSRHAAVGTTWRPWHEERPTITARVIAPDGAVHTLDPKTIAEDSVQPGNDVFVDGKKLVAPLPALAPGAIYEVFISERETAAPNGPHRALRFHLEDNEPIRHLGVTLKYPKDMKLKTFVRGGKLKAKKGRDGKLKTLTFVRPKAPPFQRSEPMAPLDAAQWPIVHVTTGGTWAQLATRYAGVVNGQLKAADLSAFKDVKPASKKPRDVAQALHNAIHSRMRYTGIEFGENAYVPVPPKTVLERRYGDCKDLSTLMVALLRERGIKASVALLRAGEIDDVLAEAPGLDRFNHAIVRIDTTPPIWHDPTGATNTVGLVPSANQGRLALVARDGVKDVERIPKAADSDATIVELRTIELHPSKGASVVERTTYGGVYAGYMRSSAKRTSASDLKEWVDQHAKSVYRPTGAVTANRENLVAGTKPYHQVINVSGARTYGLFDGAADLEVGFWLVTKALPEPLVSKFDPKTPNEERWRDSWLKRKHDLLIGSTQRTVGYEIIVPPGFEVVSLPEKLSLTVGPVSLESTARQADGRVYFSTTLKTGDGRLTPKQVVTLHEKIRALALTDVSKVKIAYAPRELRNRGKVADAIRLARKLADTNKDSVEHGSLFIDELLAAGMGSLAQFEAARLLKRFPKNTEARFAHGYALSHNYMGGYLATGMDREGALKAHRNVLAQNEKHLYSLYQMARLTSQSPHTVGSKAFNSDMKAAIDAADGLSKHHENRGLDQTLLTALVNVGDYARALKLAGEMESSAERNVEWLTAIWLSDGPAAAKQQARRVVAAADERRQLMAVAQRLFALKKRKAGVAAMEAAMEGVNDTNGFATKMLERMRGWINGNPLNAWSDGACATLKETLFSDDLLLGKRPYGDFVVKPYHSLEEYTSDKAGVGGFVGGFMAGLKNSAGDKGTADDLRGAIGITIECKSETSAEGLSMAMLTVVNSTSSTKLAVAGTSGRRRLLPVDNPVVAADLAARALKDGDTDKAGLFVDRAIKTRASSIFATDAINEILTGRKAKLLTNDELLLVIDLLSIDGLKPAATRKRLAKIADPSDSVRRARVWAAIRAKKLTEAIEELDKVKTSSKLNRGLIAAISSGYGAKGDYKKALKFLKSAKERWPEASETVTAQLASVYGYSGAWEDAEREFALLPSDGRMAKMNANNLVWTRLFSDGDLEAGVKLLTSASSPAELHTKAAVLAQLGRPAEAHKALVAAGQAASAESPRDEDYAVLARIAQSLELTEAAKHYYKRALKIPKSDLEKRASKHITSTRNLAKRWQRKFLKK